MDGRRKSRTQVSLVARYRSPTVFDFVEEQCFDLSEGGMFIKSQSPAPSGTLLKIECLVAEGPQVINAVARVVWLRDVDSPDGPRGMGVKFVKLENGSIDVINGVLTRASQSLPPPPASVSPPTASISPPPASVSPPPASAATSPEQAPEPAKAPEPVVEKVAVVAPETPLPAVLASPTPAIEPAKAQPTESASAKQNKDKHKKGNKKNKKKNGKKEPGASATPSASTTPSPVSEPIASSAPKKSVTSSAPLPTSTPGTSKESAIPTVAWLIGGIAIVVMIVVATSGKPEPEPAVNEVPPTAASAPHNEPPVVAAPVEQPAPTPIEEPTVVAAPVEQPTPTPIEEPTVAAPVEQPAPTPIEEPTAAAPTPAVPSRAGYSVNIVSTPRGASITADAQTCTAPCTLRFSDLSTPVKINASKARHHPTAATLDASQEFITRDDGTLHRTLYLKLKPEAAEAAPEGSVADPPTTE